MLPATEAGDRDLKLRRIVKVFRPGRKGNCRIVGCI